MNFSRSFFYSLLFVVLVSASVSAQGKDRDKIRLMALPENASAAETQEWLIQALTQNSSYIAKIDQPVKQIGSGSVSKQSGYTDTKISEVKFTGTVLTYRIMSSVQLNGGGTQSGSFPPVPQEESSRVRLDLKDINPDEIVLRELDGDSKSQVLSMRTYDYKRTIHLKSKDTGEATVSIANILVGGNVAEQVLMAFVRLVKLSQDIKP
jgi:hypothetical protein